MMLILFDLCARGMCDECYSLSVWCGSSLDMIDAHVGILSLHCANPCTGHRLHLYCFARVVVRFRNVFMRGFFNRSGFRRDVSRVWG